MSRFAAYSSPAQLFVSVVEFVGRPKAQTDHFIAIHASGHPACRPISTIHLYCYIFKSTGNRFE